MVSTSGRGNPFDEWSTTRSDAREPASRRRVTGPRPSASSGAVCDRKARPRRAHAACPNVVQLGDSFSAFSSACACPVGCAVSRGSRSPVSPFLGAFRCDSATSVSGVGSPELPFAVSMSAPLHVSESCSPLAVELNRSLASRPPGTRDARCRKAVGSPRRGSRRSTVIEARGCRPSITWRRRSAALLRRRRRRPRCDWTGGSHQSIPRRYGQASRPPSWHRLSPGDMPLEAKRSRHVAVAVPLVAIGSVVTVSTRQKSTESEHPDVAHHEILIGWRGR
jgi:hypothetical protein